MLLYSTTYFEVRILTRFRSLRRASGALRPGVAGMRALQHRDAYYMLGKTHIIFSSIPLTVSLFLCSPEVAVEAGIGGRPRRLPRGPLVGEAVSGGDSRPWFRVEQPERSLVLGRIEHPVWVHGGGQAIRPEPTEFDCGGVSRLLFCVVCLEYHHVVGGGLPLDPRCDVCFP